MPLTQLSTLVLPAPFGPISASNSPLSTTSEIRSSTVRPPKRSDRRSISSSAIPPPAAAILLDLAVAASLPALASEVELRNVGVTAQLLGRAVEHDLAVLHDVGVIGNLQCDRGALFDDQDGDAQFAVNLDQSLEQVAHHDRRQSERELIDQQQLRSADESARQR